MADLNDVAAAKRSYTGPTDERFFAEHSGVRVTIYRKGRSPLPVSNEAPAGNKLVAPIVVACSTTNSLGQGGSFDMTLKCPPTMELLDELGDDDWVDIEMLRNGLSWHIMRGLINEVRKTETATGSGTTVRMYQASGASWQKVWNTTPLWTRGALCNDVSGREKVAIGHPQSPTGVVYGFLKLLTDLCAKGQFANWALPQGLGGQNDSFTDLWVYDDAGFDVYDLPRLSRAINMPPSGDVWGAMLSWSDPFLCEVYTELLPKPKGSLKPAKGDHPTERLAADPYMDKGLSLQDSAMTLVYRNKPFIKASPESAGLVPGAALGAQSPWMSLPTVEVNRNFITQSNIGHSSFERYNAFFAVLNISATGPQIPEMAYPLWLVTDMQNHGMRRMDAESSYLADGAKGCNNNVLHETIRARLRDFYCLGSEMLQGTYSFGRGMGHLKVGTRLRVLGNTPPADTLTFYVEVVSHQFAAPSGWRSTASVTRGYRGDDTAQVAKLLAKTTVYTRPLKEG